MPPRRQTSAIDLQTLPAPFQELLRTLRTGDPVAALADPGPEVPGSSAAPPPGLLEAPVRVPGDVAYQLTPMEMFRLTAPSFRAPDDIGDDRLWSAEVVTQRVSKEGIEFDDDFWYDPAMLAFTTGGAAGPRPTFVLSFDAVARARGVLREIKVFQMLRSGVRKPLCTARRREHAIEELDLGAFEEARAATLDALLAKRALARDEYVRVIAGMDAVTAMLAQQQKRAAQPPPKRQARVAAPIGAAEQERARRELDVSEIYVRAGDEATNVGQGSTDHGPSSTRRAHPLTTASIAADATTPDSGAHGRVPAESTTVQPESSAPAPPDDGAADTTLPFVRRRGRRRGS